MSGPDELEPLPPELVSLLAAEKARAAPPASMQSRILERFGQAMLDSGTLPDAPGLPRADAGPTANPPAGPGVPRLPWPRMPLAAALLATGALSGAGLHALVQKREPAPPAPIVLPVAPAPQSEVPPIPAPPPSPSPSAVPLPKAVPPAGALRRNQGPAPRPGVAGPSAPPDEAARQLARDEALSAERALVEQARTALARGKAGDALAVLERHQTEFEHGRLAEERDGLRVLALLANHQPGAARARAAEFRRTYPHSLLLRTIDDALAGDR